MRTNINNVFIFFLALYTVLWGTGWNIKYINLNISELFFPIVAIYLFLKIFLEKNFTSYNIYSLSFSIIFFIINWLYNLRILINNIDYPKYF